MNKKGENKSKAWIVIVLLIAGVIAYLYFTGSTIKTVNEHKVPADLSKNEQGTGLDLKFYDCGGSTEFNKDTCQVVKIPDWFSTTPKVDAYTIVSHSNVVCSTDSSCAGYASDHTHIMCWKRVCVLGRLDFFDIGYNVTNPSTSEITFLNVQPVSATPTAFNNALNRTMVSSLAPTQMARWVAPAIGTAQFEGTNQTFTISVVGKNSYTGLNSTSGDQITFGFARNPTGNLVVSIQTVV